MPMIAFVPVERPLFVCTADIEVEGRIPELEVLADDEDIGSHHFGDSRGLEEVSQR